MDHVAETKVACVCQESPIAKRRNGSLCLGSLTHLYDPLSLWSSFPSFVLELILHMRPQVTDSPKPTLDPRARLDTTEDVEYVRDDGPDGGGREELHRSTLPEVETVRCRTLGTYGCARVDYLSQPSLDAPALTSRRPLDSALPHISAARRRFACAYNSGIRWQTQSVLAVYMLQQRASLFAPDVALTSDCDCPTRNCYARARCSCSCAHAL